MRYNDSVIIATQQRQLQTEEPPKVNECAAVDCNRRICVAHIRRILLPHVQRTYILQERRIHHHAKPSKPDIIKSNPASKTATRVSMCVSTVVESQIRIKVDPTTPASNTIIVITVSTASHVQFVIPIGIPKMSNAGSSVCMTTR